MYAFILVSNAKLDIELSALSCRLHRCANFCKVVDKHRAFPMVELLPVQSENGSCLRAPVPPAGKVKFEGCDATGDFAEPKSLLGGTQPLLVLSVAIHVGHLLYVVPVKMALASVIARSFPSATCLGRWLKPQELVMMVCSGVSQLCAVI